MKFSAGSSTCGGSAGSGSGSGSGVGVSVGSSDDTIGGPATVLVRLGTVTGGPAEADDELGTVEELLGGVAWFVGAAQAVITSEQANPAANARAANGVRALMVAHSAIGRGQVRDIRRCGVVVAGDCAVVAHYCCLDA